MAFRTLEITKPTEIHIKISQLNAFNMAESDNRILMQESEEELMLPTILPIECMEGITE